MREMKDSGVEWIGEIPIDWCKQRLRFLCSIMTGNMDTQDNNPEGAYPFYVRSPLIERSDRYTFDNEAVLMAGDGVGAGKVFHYVHGKYGCHQRVYSMSGFSHVIGKYLYYYLCENFYKKIEESNAKSTVDSVRMPMLKDFPVVFPHIEGQYAIVDYLDAKCSKIDAIIEKQQVIIEKLKEYKLSIITEAVTKGLDPDVEMKESGIEWIGIIPKDWETGKTLYALDMAITDGPHETPQLYEDGIPFVSAEAVSCGNGRIDFDHIRGYISEDFYNECCKKYVPHLNDIYMIKSGATTGRVALVDTERVFTIWSPLAVFRCNEKKMYYLYLYYFLQSDAYQKQVQDKWTYGTQQNIGMRSLEKLIVCFPPVEEQVRIAEFLDPKIKKIDLEIKETQLIINRVMEYKKSLIYEVITGKKEV